MITPRMHEGEMEITADLVGELVATQFPRFAGLPLTAYPSTGTVNAIWRLGHEYYVRVPRVAAWADGLEREIEWLPRLAPHLPLPVPVPVGVGEPVPGYTSRWAIFRWLEGEPYATDAADERAAAAELARFVAALRQVDTAGAPRSQRDRPLAARTAQTLSAIDSARDVIDARAATEVWEAALRGAPWDGRAVWTHGDLLPPNLLTRSGRLGAVLDFGNMGAGDPAVDGIPAWTLFGAVGRETYRVALGMDEATWVRSRAFALHQALLIIPYYVASNPSFVAMAKRTVGEVVADALGG